MGLLDDHSETEEEQDSNDGDSGTYIQFISGPGHRDWKDSWSADAGEAVAQAYETASPSGSDGTVNTFANAGWEDRDHFYAEVTLRLHEVFANDDFQPMLDFLLGSPGSEDTADMYADELAEFLSDEPEIAERLVERMNTEPAPADD